MTKKQAMITSFFTIPAAAHPVYRRGSACSIVLEAQFIFIRYT
jgi:hypothetical protein